MANTRPGQPFTPTLTVTDANGSPYTSGVSGTMSLYFQGSGGSDTTPIGSGAISLQPGSAWGYTFAGSLLTRLGTYRFVVASLTTPGGTLTDQGGTFEVGQGDEWTLRELYTAVRRGLRDGDTGTTTGAGTTTTLVCSKFARGSNNSWVGSELYLFEPASVSDQNPVRVTAFAASTGTFTFTPAITLVASGTDFIIGDKDDRGWSHDEVLEAITTAIRRQRTARRVVNQVAITTSTTTFEYAVPAGWIAVDAVEYQPALRYADYWLPMARGTFWRFHPERGVLALTLPQWNQPLRITGRATPQVPGGMNDLVQADGATIKDDAIYELLMQSDDAGHRQRAAGMQAGVMRARMGAGLARL